MSEQVSTNAPAAPVASQEAPASEATEQSNESVESSQEESSQVGAKSDKASAAETKKEEAKLAKKIKQLKLKVDGKEELADLPFEIDENPEVVEYMTKQLQLAKAAQKRMSEASDYKKKLDQVGEYLQQAKGNPKKIRELMKDLDIDEKQLAAMIVEEELDRAKKSPEQLEKERLESELQKLKDEREKEKKELESREYERLVQQETERYDLMFTAALDKAQLPKSPYIVKRVTEYMLKAIDKGLDVTADDVIPLVREEMQDDIRSMFSSAPEELIEQLLGKDNLKRLRKRNLEKAKEPPVPLNKQVQDTGSKDTKPKEEPRVSFRDYFKKL